MYRKYFLVLSAAFLLVNCKHKVPDPSPGTTTTTTTTGTTTGSTTGTIVAPPPTAENKKDSICFDEEIQPMLITYCNGAQCHNDTVRMAGINLSSFAGVRNTVSGALLVRSVKEPGPLQMPYDTLPKLSSSQISLIENWVLQGMQQGIDCCDTTGTQSYGFKNVILPGMQASCIAACHTTQVPVFTNYSQIVDVKDRIKCTLGPNAGKTNQCSAMPREPYTLSFCAKRKILKWIDNGAPNN